MRKSTVVLGAQRNQSPELITRESAAFRKFRSICFLEKHALDFPEFDFRRILIEAKGYFPQTVTLESIAETVFGLSNQETNWEISEGHLVLIDRDQENHAENRKPRGPVE